MQKFIDSDEYNVLIMNLPPRHGKSRTAQLFTQWLLGNRPNTKIMTGSYNETLSKMFSKSVRNAIQEVKADDDITVFSDVFPSVRVATGDAQAHLWSIEGQTNSYLATSPTGTATGFGCSLMIIDDIIKNSEEAYNANVKESHWDWFTNTMLSRLEEGGKIIIIMTRWASDDLAGRAIEHFQDDPLFKAKVITMKAMQDDGTMLCDDVLSKASYISKVRAMGEDIASANFQQIPIDLKGCLYSQIMTYDELPTDDKGNVLFTAIKNYTDTADTGSDYLASIVYGVYNKEAYVLDIVYTKDAMEITEPAVADMLYCNNVNIADIESNNGGRGFSRNVMNILRDKYKTNRCSVNAFHQSGNKIARIQSNATWVMNHVYFPKNWRDKWPQFASDIMKYQREGKNAHDDAPDALTGIAEKINAPQIKSGRINIY
ncbi:phage terminase large subunit [Veillonella caviae]|uniref:phage terminase large subunit n=1 Tax=Veillonella caviae TaxID=248316 RepID=UPI0023A85944|nr:phage terminase large subunit [Veillonella caviae]MCI5708681.1 phage terminase large subunit [Veillonella caviae]MDY5716008.1 phage terminase large subunit [Veillonella caviae]